MSAVSEKPAAGGIDHDDMRNVHVVIEGTHWTYCGLDTDRMGYVPCDEMTGPGDAAWCAECVRIQDGGL